MESRARNKPRLGRRFLVRGESLIASTGLVLAAILLASMAATGYWTLRTQRDALDSDGAVSRFGLSQYAGIRNCRGSHQK